MNYYCKKNVDSLVFWQLNESPIDKEAGFLIENFRKHMFEYILENTHITFILINFSSVMNVVPLNLK